MFDLQDRHFVQSHFSPMLLAVWRTQQSSTTMFSPQGLANTNVTVDFSDGQANRNDFMLLFSRIDSCVSFFDAVDGDNDLMLVLCRFPVI